VTDEEQPQPGAAVWFDLTVPDAAQVRDFYASVVGWEPEPLDMGGYSDFIMKSPAGAGVAGVCHARGDNADLPAQWLTYVVVPSLEASLERCRAGGGEVVTEIKGLGGTQRYAVIRDPAGAYMALMQIGGDTPTES
jgi:predicted enzyme related to lactoylglutathione lyase